MNLTSQLTETYPYAYEYAGDNLTKLLSAAISMRGMPMELADYAVICSPALRALEGLMKKSVTAACGKNLIDFGDVFMKVSQVPPMYALKQKWKDQIKCKCTCYLLEECYSYYVPNRHGTFHASGVDAEIRIIKDRTQALEISTVCLDLINNHSKILLEKNEELQNAKN